MAITKEKLRDAIQLVREADDLEKRIETLEARLYYAHSPKLDGMPKSNAQKDKTDLYDSHIELMDIYKKQLTALNKSHSEIMLAINNLEETEKRAVTLRYIDGKSIKVVAAEMGFEERQVYRILRSAEDKICQ